jgi:hypothetical protein
VAFITEVTRGTTPATTAAGAMQVVPIIQGTRGSLNRNFEKSNVIRSDRQGGAQVGGTSFGQGQIVCPLAYWTKATHPYLAFIESLINAAFGAESGGDYSALAATTRKAFTIEFLYRDGATVISSDRFKGAEITDAQIEIPTSGAAQITFTFQAIEVATTTSVLATDPAGYTAVTAYTQMSGSQTGAALTLGDTGGGSQVAFTGVESQSYTITNNATMKFATGSALADHTSQGDFEVTGNLSVYKYANAIQTAYAADTHKSLVVTLASNAADKKIVLTMGDIVFTRCEKGESDSTVVEQCEVYAQYDGTITSKLKWEYIDV